MKNLKFIFSKIIIYFRYTKIKEFFKYIFFGNEITNFTYEINNHNEIIHTINNITKCDYKKIDALMKELDFSNTELKNFFSERFYNDFKSKNIFGRRYIWYLLVRIIKPKIVIESGIFQGLGSALLSFALYMNNKDDKELKSKFIGLDIKLNTPYLNKNAFKQVNIFLNEVDSLIFLKNFNEKNKIIYISDAKHEFEFEKKEFDLILKNLDKGSLIISDNGSKALSEFTIKHKKKMTCFSEEVKNHWYPGAKCCVSFDF